MEEKWAFAIELVLRLMRRGASYSTSLGVMGVMGVMVEAAQVGRSGAMSPSEPTWTWRGDMAR